MANARERGIITTKNGETIILLPPGPIRERSKGGSGEDHETVLFDDPELGRPTRRIQPDKVVHKQQY